MSDTATNLAVECFGGPMDGGRVMRSEIIGGRLERGIIGRNSGGFTWDWVKQGELPSATVEYKVSALKLRHVRTRNT